ncbi:MAG: hypothetical protein ABSE75_10710 [Acidimicrobiales bacterium]
MSEPTSRLRAVRHRFVNYTLTAAVSLLVVVVVVLVTLAVSGLLLSPVAPDPASPTTTTTLTPVRPAPHDAAPSASMVTALLGDLKHESGFSAQDPSFAATNPLLNGCSSQAIPVAQESRTLTLSSTTLSVVADVDVFGPGLGALVLARTLTGVAACAGDYVLTTSPTGLDGFVASGPDVSGSSILEVTWRRGDVLVSLYAFPTGYQSATSATLALAAAIDVQFAGLMQSVCVNEVAPVAAARRNPTQTDYTPYATRSVVSPPASVPRPNLALLNGPAPAVIAPPAGSITTAPVAPVVPTIALSASVLVPASDVVGPGCGWAFTQSVPPTPPVSEPLSELDATAIAQLEAKWSSWPTTVASYLQAKAVYVKDLASYNATTTTTTTTTVPVTTTTTTPVTTTTTAPPA